MLSRSCMRVTVAVLALVAIAAASSDDEKPSTAGTVVQLTEQNFTQTIAKGNWFVKFYAPWCGHCRAMAAEYTKLASLTGERCNIAEIDADANPAIAEQYGVRGYPTLKLFKDGEAVEQSFVSNRIAEVMLGYLERNEALELEVPEEVAILKYFGSRGRAEAIRLALNQAGVAYQDIAFTKDTWAEEKAKGIKEGSLPFGQLPVLTVGNNFYIAQSAAIMKYIGRKHGMYSGDEEQLAKIDMILGGVEDLRKQYGLVVYNPKFEDLKDKYITETLPTWLKHLEAFRTKSDASFLFGEELTIADIALFDILDVNMRMSKECLDNFPGLKTHYSLVGSSPRIATYIASTRRPEHANGASAFFDNEANPSTEGLR